MNTEDPPSPETAPLAPPTVGGAAIVPKAVRNGTHPTDPEGWQSILVDGAFPVFPRKGATIKIKALAELVSLAGMQMKVQVAWLPVEGVMLDLQGICHTAEAKLSRRPEEVEFTVRPADGPIQKLTLPYGALACVFVKAPS